MRSVNFLYLWLYGNGQFTGPHSPFWATQGSAFLSLSSCSQPHLPRFPFLNVPLSLHWQGCPLFPTPLRLTRTSPQISRHLSLPMLTSSTYSGPVFCAFVVSIQRHLSHSVPFGKIRRPHWAVATISFVHRWSQCLAQWLGHTKCSVHTYSINR